MIPAPPVIHPKQPCALCGVLDHGHRMDPRFGLVCPKCAWALQDLGDWQDGVLMLSAERASPATMAQIGAILRSNRDWPTQRLFIELLLECLALPIPPEKEHVQRRKLK